jgi:hypothetical protein
MAAAGDGRAALAADIAAVYVNDASDRVAAAARQVVAALHARTGDGVSAFHAMHCTTPQRRRVDETLA